MKTKSFHSHVRGRHFRDYHLLLDEQAAQIFAMTDDIAEREQRRNARAVSNEVANKIEVLPDVSERRPNPLGDVLPDIHG